MRGVLHHLHGEGVDVHVGGLDPVVIARHVPERPLPEIVAVGQGVALVRHQHAPPPARPRVLKGVPDDPLDSLAGVDVLLDRDLVRGALLEDPPHADVQTLRVLAEHHEVDVAGGASFQGREVIGQEADRPLVDVQIELEADPEQDIGRVPVVRDAGIPQRAQQDRIIGAQGIESGIGKSLSRLQEVIGAVRQRLEVKRAAARQGGGAQRLDGFTRHLDSDSITGDDSDPRHGQRTAASARRRVRITAQSPPDPRQPAAAARVAGHGPTLAGHAVTAQAGRLPERVIHRPGFGAAHD